MKYFFWILGCAMNYSDAERISAILDGIGYKQTLNEKEADIFIVVSCSVRQSAINRIYGKAKELREKKANNTNFKTILTGCVLEPDKKKLQKVFDIMIDIKDIATLPGLLGKGNKDNDFEDYFRVSPRYESSFRAFVPISTGCDNFCSYCAVPYTRGREKSRPAEEIIKEVKGLITSGYKEITLLGQNVNSYAYNLIELFNNIDKIEGDYRVYFYSNHPKDMSKELVLAISKLKHFPHYIHLPLQSGNDEILRRMNRHYTKEKYLELVKMIRAILPKVTLTTDIIVGYPGETEKQFEDTTDVMKQARFDMAFIAQYSPRPGTVSAKETDNIPLEEKKQREAYLQKILAETVLEHNQKLLYTNQLVLVDEFKKNKYFGRTEGYKVVEIKTDQKLTLGQFINVKIEKASSWKLLGSSEDFR